MKRNWVLRGVAGVIVLSGIGCAQDKTTDTSRSSHFNARHRVIGSNIPTPDRGGGNDDTSAQSIDQQVYQQQTERAAAGSRGFGSMSSGGAGGR